MFAGSSKARKLCTDAFSWSENNLNRMFQGCRTATGFVEKWDMEVGLKLTEAGMVKYGEHLDLLNPSSSLSLLESSPSSALVTSKRVRTEGLPTLYPASKRTCLEPEELQQFDDTSMDKDIREYFVGKVVC